ncbi:unnamed protein product [Peniophora sp. CBMAI 1063]|nr:unnamed protein product [Peniophora sp. CBMAI 1063]
MVATGNDESTLESDSDNESTTTDMDESSPEAVVERLAAHLNPDPSLPFTPVETIKAFRKWATPQRLWIVDDSGICRRNWDTGRAIIVAPTRVPTAEGEIGPYKLDTAPFVVGDTRELVDWRFGKWDYLGTYIITSINTLSVEDASRIRRPYTASMAKIIAHYAVPKAHRAQLLSMLEDGTARVNAIAVTRTGSNGELIKFGRGNRWELKKESLKKTEQVHRLLAVGMGSLKIASRVGVTKRKKAMVVKKEESDWN